MNTAMEPVSTDKKEETLLGSDFTQGLRSRWDHVQAGFVDEPREAVKEADALVDQAIQKLSQGFGDARSRLEQQWDRGEEVSTEDLRIALQKYRAFFNKLLSI
jgi:hypothetical protein